MKVSSLVRAAISAAACAFLLTSCGMMKSPPPRANALLYEWNDDGGPGDLSVEIDLADQKALFRRGERPIGWSFVSTGKEGHSSSPGQYAITEKMEVKYSDRYGWISDADGKVTNGDAKPTTPVPPGEIYNPAPMRYWMRLTTYGMGLHAGEIPQPGVAASHGCIRFPKDCVPKLFDAAKIGTPVKIVHKAGRAGSWAPFAIEA